MPTGADIVNAAYELLGAPYRLWYPGMSLPTWLDDGRGDPPPATHIQAMGVECADLVAYALVRNGLSYPYPQAGTGAFGDFLVDTSDFDPDAPGQAGAIAFNPYRGPAWNDQGHIAVYVDSHTLIQAIGSGVTDAYSDQETYAWGGSTAFEVYGFLPGVDYSKGGDDGSGQSQPAASARWRWIAIDRDGWLRADGPDWSRGWFDTEWKWRRPDDAGD